MPATVRLLRNKLTPAVANVANDLVTIPRNKYIPSITFLVHNKGTTDETIDCSVAFDGEADSLDQYIYTDMPMPAGATQPVMIDMPLKGGDIIRVKTTSAGNMVFTVSAPYV